MVGERLKTKKGGVKECLELEMGKRKVKKVKIEISR